MNASEAAYGVLVWLGTRPQHVLLGGCRNPVGISKLAKQFCAENKLPQLNVGWGTRLRVPVTPVQPTSTPQKYLCASAVTAVQITEETFHPASPHLEGVAYDPVAKTATVNGFTARCGDWIVFCQNGDRYIETDTQFQAHYHLTEGLT